MSCVPIPTTPIPTLPSPLTLGVAPPLPPELDIPGLCCKLPPIPIPPLPIPIPAIGLAPVMAVMNELVGKLTAFVNSLPLSCPLE